MNRYARQFCCSNRYGTKKKIDFNIDLQPVCYYGNAELMMLIWINVIGNSIKFTPKKRGNYHWFERFLELFAGHHLRYRNRHVSGSAEAYI